MFQKPISSTVFGFENVSYQPVLVGWSNLPLEGRCSYERR